MEKKKILIGILQYVLISKEDKYKITIQFEHIEYKWKLSNRNMHLLKTNEDICKIKIWYSTNYFTT